MIILRLALVLMATSTVASAPQTVDHRLSRYESCPGLTGKLIGSATDITADLAIRWQTNFAHVQPGITVEIDMPSGPPQAALNPGLQAFVNGRRDFAIVSRDLSDADVATFKSAHGEPPIRMPIALGSLKTFGYLDPVVFIVNDANPLRRVTLRQLAALLGHEPTSDLTRPTQWGALGVAKWTGRAIHISGGGAWRGPYSARAQVVREIVLVSNNQQNGFRGDLDSGSEADVPAGVVKDPLAIGFTGLGHVLPGTHVLAISAGNLPAVAPNFNTIADGRYPLARTVNLYVASRRLTPLLSAWTTFLQSQEGQNVVLGTGRFLPMTKHSALSTNLKRPPAAFCRPSTVKR